MLNYAQIRTKHLDLHELAEMIWKEKSAELTELLAVQWLGSLLRPRFAWAYGIRKYSSYNKTEKHIWLNVIQADTHLTLMASSELDLANKSYVIDFRVVIDKYPLEEAPCFEFGFFPIPTHFCSPIPSGHPFRASHDNAVTLAQHTAYKTCRLAMVHAKADATDTYKKFTLIEYPYAKYMFRRSISVRFILTKSKIRVIVMGLGDKQGYLEPIRWCMGLKPHLMIRTGTGGAGTKVPYYCCYENITIYEYDTVDYEGDLPTYPVWHGMKLLSSCENIIGTVRNAFWWRSKVVSGVTSIRHGNSDALSTFELNVTTLDHYGFYVTKMGGSKNSVGTSDFLHLENVNMLTLYENWLINSITKYEVPQKRQAINYNTDWDGKVLGGTWSRGVGTRNADILAGYEDDLDWYKNWELKPLTKGYGGAIECLFNPNPLTVHENNIIEWGKLGDMLWGSKALGGVVTITYG